MIPYLLLPGDRRSRVRKVLEEHAFDDDTVDAALLLLEELGPDADRICEALHAEERNGYMIVGTYNAIALVMNGSPREDVDWQSIPRRGRR